MQSGILKHAILHFRWVLWSESHATSSQNHAKLYFEARNRFYALKATPNRPFESVGLGTPAILTVVCEVGHSRDSHSSLWGWALQGFSPQSVGLGTPGILTVVCVGLGGWALQEVVSTGEE